MSAWPDSVEIRLKDSEFECQLGRFINSEADPRRGLKHLMLVAPETVNRLLENGPEPAVRGDGTVSCTQNGGGKMFFHLDTVDGRTTWQLFYAHWWDGKGPEILVGRWPD